MVTVLLAGPVTFLLLPQIKENRIQKNLDLGMQYLNEFDYENAILYFTEVLQIDPMNAEAKEALARAYQNYGNLLFEQGDYEVAVKMYLQLIGL